jgi:hypothetical protein
MIQEFGDLVGREDYTGAARLYSNIVREASSDPLGYNGILEVVRQLRLLEENVRSNGSAEVTIPTSMGDLVEISIQTSSLYGGLRRKMMWIVPVNMESAFGNAWVAYFGGKIPYFIPDYSLSHWLRRAFFASLGMILSSLLPAQLFFLEDNTPFYAANILLGICCLLFGGVTFESHHKQWGAFLIGAGVQSVLSLTLFGFGVVYPYALFTAIWIIILILTGAICFAQGLKLEKETFAGILALRLSGRRCTVCDNPVLDLDQHCTNCGAGLGQVGTTTQQLKQLN